MKPQGQRSKLFLKVGSVQIAVANVEPRVMIILSRGTALLRGDGKALLLVLCVYAPPHLILVVGEKW